MAGDEGHETLEKRLGLFDVYAISIGAMFSSGFFFLPGIAAAEAGPAVVLAYGLSAVLMLPALFSIAELSSAMPRAGGAYFFIHRSMGPLAGMIGGIGLWLTLVLKSAFAFVGMGAYLVLFFDVPAVPLAIALTVAFGLLNTFGAKETAWFQNLLVSALIPIIVYYVLEGLFDLGANGFGQVHAERFTPFAPAGVGGVVSTIGLVMISYAGLTKIASAAEEVRRLDRNLPLGMLLALGTAAALYVGGVYVTVGALERDTLHGDLTPIATGAEAVVSLLSPTVGVVLVVLAAVAAFTSTGNAGILAASRYPLAMARDALVWRGFDRIGRFGTPTLAIVATCTLMIASILFLDVERLAKLGSAFILLTFALINVAVIIMRESHIESYAPGFRSPLYPWAQIVGAVTMLGLIPTLGLFAVAFVAVIVIGAAAWYRLHAKGRVSRAGAIYHLFARLAHLGDAGVDLELWRLLQERGTSPEDSYEEVVLRSHVLQPEERLAVADLLDRLVEEVSADIPVPGRELRARLDEAEEGLFAPEGASVVLLDLALDELEHPVLVLVRLPEGLSVDTELEFPGDESDDDRSAPGAEEVDGLVVLLGPGEDETKHLRLLAELTTQVEREEFGERWRAADGEHDLKESLLRHEWFITLQVEHHGATARLADERIRDVDWPEDVLVALVRRGDEAIFPSGGTKLAAGDRLTVIGPPDQIGDLLQRYVHA